MTDTECFVFHRRHTAWKTHQYRVRYRWLSLSCNVVTRKSPYIMKKLQYLVEFRAVRNYDEANVFVGTSYHVKIQSKASKT